MSVVVVSNRVVGTKAGESISPSLTLRRGLREQGKAVPRHSCEAATAAGSDVRDHWYTGEPTPEHLPYWRMKASKSATAEIIAGLALAIAAGATVYYGYLAWLLVSPD